MSELKAKQLIRFRPESGSGGGGGSGQTNRLSISLYTRLIGLVRRQVVGYRLYADLLIRFAPLSICSRLRLLGVDPSGHAPLVLTRAQYCDSIDVCYGGPSTSIPIVLYADETASRRPTLAIGWPARNLYPFFQWPAGIFAFDPPLDPSEPVPDYSLALKELKGLVDPADPEGVRLPMRLIAKRSDEPMPDEKVIDALIYEEAPGFTGSGTRVTYHEAPGRTPKPPGQAVWAVTGPQLATHYPEALGAPATPGDEEAIPIALYWRIYKGSGDMIYQAICNGSALPDQTYRDRRDAGIGGGPGIIATTDLHVADIWLEPVPFPFLLNADTQVNLDGITRPYVGDYHYHRYWRRVEQNQETVLSWTGNVVSAGGWLYAIAPEDVLAACWASEQIPNENPPRRRQVIRVLCADRKIYHLRPSLPPDRPRYARAVCTIPEWPSLYWPAATWQGQTVQPARTLEANPFSCSFSQDGLKVCCYTLPILGTNAWYPGVVWELTLSEVITDGQSLLEAGAWTQVYQDPEPTVTETFTGTRYGDPGTIGTHPCNSWINYEWWKTHSAQDVPLLLAAGYRDNQRVIRVVRFTWALTEHEKEYQLLRKNVINTFIPPSTWMCQFDSVRTLEYLYEVYDAQERIKIVDIIGGSESMVTWMRHAGYAFHRKRTDSKTAHRTIFSGSPCPCQNGPTPTLTPSEVWWNMFNGFLPYIERRSFDVPLVSLGEYYRIIGSAQNSTIDNKTLKLYKPNTNEAQLLPDAWLSVEHPAIDTNTIPAGTIPAWPNALSGYPPHRIARLVLPMFALARPLTIRSATSKDGDWLTGVDLDGYRRTGLYRLQQDVAYDLGQGPVQSVTPLTKRLYPSDVCREIADYTPDELTADDLIEAINAWRQAQGLSVLEKDQALMDSILEHLLWCRQNDVLSHIGEGGSDPLSRAQDKGFTGPEVGETLARGQWSPWDVIMAWTLNADDLAVLSDPDWTVVGAAVLQRDAGGYWWGAVYGRLT